MAGASAKPNIVYILLANTIAIAMGDNGFMSGERGLIDKMRRLLLPSARRSIKIFSTAVSGIKKSCTISPKIRMRSIPRDKYNGVLPGAVSEKESRRAGVRLL
ncbi:hypothetical protein [Erwinia sp. 198]|uniref:hypothetical protein n=1 Tax=Erwinia sp. 198 TaxID=2022746 RepID=UPI000F690978|nr:hypothetical protein [Erwinia sp. 198]